MDVVPDSGEEDNSFSKQNMEYDAGNSERERVYSDNEDAGYCEAERRMLTSSSQREQRHSEHQACAYSIFGASRQNINRTNNERRGHVKSQQHPHRRLMTRAAASQQAAIASQSQENPLDASGQPNMQSEMDWSKELLPISKCDSLPILSATNTRNFVGRDDLWQQRRVASPVQASQAENADDGDHLQGIIQPALIPDMGKYGIPDDSVDREQPKSKGGVMAIVHREEENGVNVIFSRRDRQREFTDTDALPSKARSSVNAGWGKNFVRIDLKKGHGSTKYRSSKSGTSRRRFTQGRWKPQRLRKGGDGADYMEGWEQKRGPSCYRCGETGHFARECPMLFEDEEGTTEKDELPVQEPAPIAESLSQIDRIESVPTSCPLDVHALCDSDFLHAALRDSFGFTEFRGLQWSTVQSILRGESCLSIMPTGMGKSLCYQLPALLLPGLTVVVSPLIALMHDQVKSAPPSLNPALLWSGQAPKEARQVLEDIQGGKTRLLFISPERLGNSLLIAALRPRMPLSLIVVDEAHCVAEWGHSFRPAYFRLGEAVHRHITARSVLALTATATKATEQAVCDVLRISKQRVLRDSTIRPNLRLHVARSWATPAAASQSAVSTGWRHIASLFKKGGPLAASRAAIVYCAWKSDADSLSSALVAAGINSEAYHAGRNFRERLAVETAFAAGKLRVVVATIAFGMGINIAQVDAVVHATMPRSLEEYVQQIGRAGRTGNEAYCYTYLADEDFVSLRSLAFSGMIQKENVVELLNILLGDDASTANSGGRRFGVLPCRKLAAELDMSEESMEAVLGYLEADKEPYLQVLPKVGMNVKVSFYEMAPEQIVDKEAAVQAVLQACPRPRNGLYSMTSAKFANAVQKPPAAALQDLQELATRSIIGFELSSDQGPAYEILRQPDDIETLGSNIFKRLDTMLRCQVARLDKAYRAFDAAVHAGFSGDQATLEAELRKSLDQYFAEDEVLEATTAIQSGKSVGKSQNLEGLPLRLVSTATAQSAKAVVQKNREQGGPTLSAVAVARILHGIGSPALPRDVWRKRMGAFWGSSRNVDFHMLLETCSCTLNSLT